MSTPAGPYRPTNALVAVAWLGQRVDGIAETQVATKLPRETASWAAEGFVQVTIVPGAPDIELPSRHPLVQVDCWAVSPDSTKPPVGKANRLAELILAATDNRVQRFGRPVTLKAGYLPAIVNSVYPMTEPSEVPDDAGGFARVTFDLVLDWVPA